MIRLDNIETMNWENALRGMRNPLESWERSDSRWVNYDTGEREYFIGENDMRLAMTLTLAGSDDSKFLRQIFVTMDITAPEYWWKEFDTYKVGTVANSTSTMHKLGSRLLTFDDFSYDEITPLRKLNLFSLNQKIKAWQKHRKSNPELAKAIWRKMIQDLPTSYNYLRTVTLNYQVLRSMYHARKNHKLEEWRTFCLLISLLPNSELITAKR